MADPKLPKFEDTKEALPSFDSTVETLPNFDQTAGSAVSASALVEANPVRQGGAVNVTAPFISQTALQTGGLLSDTSAPNPDGSLASSFYQGLTGLPKLTAQGIEYLSSKSGLPLPPTIKRVVKAVNALPEPAKPASDTLVGAVVEGIGGSVIPVGLSKVARAAAKTQALQTEVAGLALKNTGELPSSAIPSPKTLDSVAKASTSLKIKAAFDPKTPTPTVFSSKDAQAAKKADQLITRTMSRLDTATKEAESISDPVAKALKLQEVDRISGHLNQQQQKFKEAIESPAYKALKEAKDTIGDVTMSVNGRETPVFRQTLTKQGAYISPQEIEVLNGAKDVGKIQSSAISSVDQLRLLQEADGNQINGPLRQMIFQPAEDALVNAKNQADDLRNAFRQQVVDLGIDSSAKRQQFLFQAAEKRLSPAQLESLTDNERQFIDYTKKLYSDLLDQINAKRSNLGYDAVKKRKDYITHLNEWNVWDSLGLGPDAAVGSQAVSPYAKKLKSAFSYEKARKGGAFKENLIEAVEAYIDPASRQLNTLDTGALLHGRAKFLPPNLRKATTEWINSALMGGIDAKDAAIMNAGFQPALRVANRITGLTSRGTILGNIKVITDQPSQVLETVRQAGLMPMLRGHAQAFFNPPVELQRASSFLTLRNINDDLVQIPKSVLTKPVDWMKSVLEFSDKYVARASWYAGFNKAQQMGLSQPAAIKYADDVARMLHGNYNALYKPAILRGKSGVTFAPLQNYAFNTWNHMVRDPKVLAELKNTSTLRQVLGTLGAMFATNQIYEAMGLQGPFGVQAPQELSAEGVIKAAKNTAVNVVPLAKSINYGSPSPILNQVKEEAKFLVGADAPKSVLRNSMVAIFSDNDDSRTKAKQDIFKAGAIYAPFGLQAMKTIEGVKAARDGYYKVGNEEVELTPRDKKLGLVFGPGASPSVRKVKRENELQKIARGLSRERN